MVMFSYLQYIICLHVRNEVSYINYLYTSFHTRQNKYDHVYTYSMYTTYVGLAYIYAPYNDS